MAGAAAPPERRENTRSRAGRLPNAERYSGSRAPKLNLRLELLVALSLFRPWPRKPGLFAPGQLPARRSFHKRHKLRSKATTKRGTPARKRIGKTIWMM